MPKAPKILIAMNRISEADARMLNGIAEYARLKGPWVFVKEPPFELTCIDTRVKTSNCVTTSKVNGIITKIEKSSEIKKIIPAGVPAINLLGPLVHLPGISRDSEKIAKMATDYFLERGLKSFAYFGCPFLSTTNCVKCSQIFVNRIAKAGFKTDIYTWQKKKYTFSSLEKEQSYVGDWLISLPKPVGIMACTDYRGKVLLDICKKAGMLVPEEVVVLSVGNDRLICELCDPPLSSIDFDFENAGYKAAELLDQLVTGQVEATHKKIPLYPISVVTRHSTDFLAIEDQIVAQSLRFIHENIKEMIQVPDVAAAVAVSRQVLHKRFRLALGRTVHQEIRRAQVKRIAGMLLETNLSVSEIASALGYTSTRYIERNFRKEKQMTPKQFRKRFGLKQKTIN